MGLPFIAFAVLHHGLGSDIGLQVRRYPAELRAHTKGLS
jgi:hypothetical protein